MSVSPARCVLMGDVVPEQRAQRLVAAAHLIDQSGVASVVYLARRRDGEAVQVKCGSVTGASRLAVIGLGSAAGIEGQAQRLDAQIRPIGRISVG